MQTISFCDSLIHCVSKKVPTFILSVSLSNFNRFHTFCIAGKCMKFAIKAIRHCPPYLRPVPALPWEIKKFKFLTACQLCLSPATFLTALFSVSQEICLSTSLLCTLSITNFLLKSCSRRWIPCWLLTNTAVTSAVTNFRCHKLTAKVNNRKYSDMKILFAISMGKGTPCFKHQKYQSCGRITKLTQYACIFFHMGEYLQKFEFLISQGIVATCLRWNGRCHIGFVANFIRFPGVQKFWESVKIWQSYREFKGGNFWDTV